MRSRKKWLLIMLSFALALAATGAGLYYKRHQTARKKNRPKPVAEGEPRLVVQKSMRATNGAFSSDGKLLAISNCDAGEVVIFDILSGKEIRKFNNFTNYYSGNDACRNLIGFSADAKTVAYISDEYVKSSKANLDHMWTFDVYSGKVYPKKKLPVFSGLIKSDFDEKKFKESLETRVFVKLPGGGVASGESMDSFKIQFPGVEPLSEVEIQKEKKRLIDDYVRESKERQLMSAYQNANISISNDQNSLDIVDNNVVETFDLATGKKTRTGSNNNVNTNKSEGDGVVTKSSDGKFVATQDEHGIQLKSIENGKLKVIQQLKFDAPLIPQSFFTKNGFYTLNKLSSNGNQFSLRDETRGKDAVLFNADYLKSPPSRLADTAPEIAADVSDDGERIATLFNNELNVFEIISGKKSLSLKLTGMANSDGLNEGNEVEISPRGTFVAVNHTGQIFEVTTGREVYNNGASFSSVTFSNDEKSVVHSSPTSLIDVETWNKVNFAISDEKVSSEYVLTLKFGTSELDASQEVDNCQENFNHAKFSPNGRFLVIAGSAQQCNDAYPFFIIWDKSEKRLVRSLEIDSIVSPRSAFSPDNRLIAISDETKIKLFETVSGKEIKNYIGHTDIILRLQFSPDGNFLLSESQDNTSKIWEVESGKELLQMVKFQNGDWIVTTPDGRFDTNNLDKVEGMHWIMSSEPLRPLPLEIFMRQYYEPKLLARMLAGEKFKPLPSLAELNRTQPAVKITEIKPDGTETVQVTVEVANARSAGQKDSSGNSIESGVYDVRLFRDGQLVGYAPKNEVAVKDNSWWSWLFGVPANDDDGEVELNMEGKATLQFSNIKFPRTGVEQVEFSAYAFNADRIKSATDRQPYKPAAKPTTVKGRAYIISLGVNASEHDELSLRYAANDARQMQMNVVGRLATQGVYEEVIGVPLVSDFAVTLADGRTAAAQDATVQEVRAGRKSVTENRATKAHLQAVLDVLAGRNADVALLKELPNADKLRAARPEDLVIISASSHGYTDSDGIFYLVPSDTGTAAVSTPDFRQHCVSSDELSRWLRDVDAGELVLIVDACHSAAAIEGSDFKPGPMGSRGLGQLSYDKGMKILTATQTDSVAYETDKVRQGLLMYALLQDGLGARNWADYNPQDRKIMLTEWLGYGVARVPRLYEEVKAGQSSSKDVRIIREIVDAREADESKTQLPSLFNFARQQREVVLARQP